MLDRYMDQLAEELGAAGELRPQTPGVYVLPIAEGLAVEINDLTDYFYFRAVLAPLPFEQQGAFFEQVMLANLFGQGTDGAVLGLDGDKQLVLSHTVPADVDYRTFRDTFEDFMNTAEIWQGEASQPTLSSQK